MAIISEIEEENNTNKPTSSSPVPNPQSTVFTTNFDPSNPTDFLNKVFDFLANETNFLENDTAEKEILASFRGVKAKIFAEEKAKAEKNLIEEKAKAAAVAAEAKKEKDVLAEFYRGMFRKMKLESNVGTQIQEAQYFLPEDLLKDVFSRLSAESLFRCRRVCKYWYAIIMNRKFISNDPLIQPYYYFHRHENTQPNICVNNCLYGFESDGSVTVFDFTTESIREIRTPSSVVAQDNIMLISFTDTIGLLQYSQGEEEEFLYYVWFLKNPWDDMSWVKQFVFPKMPTISKNLSLLWSDQVMGSSSDDDAPNKGNGMDLEKYSWTQSPQELTVNVPLPNGTRFVICEIKKNHLKVALEGQPPIVDGELYQSVKPDDCYWNIEDQNTVSILLTKVDQLEWWKSLIKGDPEIDTQKVEPNSKFSDLDPTTRSCVEKMMIYQTQKSMCLPPTSD